MQEPSLTQSTDSQPQIRYKRIQHYLYDMENPLGSGNFSTVYKGIEESTNKEIAVKVVKLNSLTFQKLEELHEQQITIIRELDHPHVLRCIEVLKSKLCEGGSLEEKLKEKGKLTEAELFPIASQLYEGLKYLNQKQIVHRDLKPANIFLKDGQVKIADFGFAVHAKSSFTDCSIGSPLYMSPQGYIHCKYGPKTEVWAFGVILFELLHGKQPFIDCVKVDDLIRALSNNVIESRFKQGLSPQIKELIRLCLQVKEHKRISIKEIQHTDYMMGKCRKRASLNFEIAGGRRASLTVLGDQTNGARVSYQTFHTVKNIDKAHKRASVQLNYGTFHSIQSFDKENQGVGMKKEKSSQYLNLPEVSLRLKTKSVQETEDMLIPGRITFNESIGLIHYCRTGFKFIKEHPTDLLDSAVLSLLITLLQELLKRADNNQIVYDLRQTKIKKESKLKHVLGDYLKKYKQEHQKLVPVDLHDIHQKVNRELGSLEKSQESKALYSCYLCMLFSSFTSQFMSSRSKKDYSFFGKGGVVDDSLSDKSIPRSVRDYVDCKQRWGGEPLAT